MNSTDIPLAIRAGEHACCRFPDAEDRERLAAAFVRGGLLGGRKVLYLCDRDDPDAFAARLGGLDADVEAALASGQMEVRRATDVLGDAADLDEVLSRWPDEQARALAEGYKGVSVTGEMTWALCGSPEGDGIAEYEQRLADLIGHEAGTFTFLCQYDHGRFPAGTLADVAAAHRVDMSPELATVGREGCLAAARISDGETLRLSGELDFSSAEALGDVLRAHFHGKLQLDLADLDFVDVAGMRALRGTKEQPLIIVAASDCVHRLVSLLAWDTAPGIEIAAPA